MSSSTNNRSLLRDALSATAAKEKGPPIADGVLSITPDTPDVVEWRRSALDITETSSTYLDDEEEGNFHVFYGGMSCYCFAVCLACLLGFASSCAAVGPKPHELYGKFTWKIENFSEISKRELRSNVFDVGGYKWCASTPSLPRS